MSANITVREDGFAEMMYAGETPWHSLGQRLDNCVTSAEAIKAAGLDWKVGLTPAQYTHEGKLMTLKDRFVVRRLDNGFGLGTVGPNWTPLQPSEGFSMLDALVGEKAAIFETAGSLAGGRKIWMLAQTGNVLRVGESGDDIIKPYLLGFIGFDGSLGVNFKLTGTRVVCQNTLTVAMKDAGALVRLRHTAGIADKVAEVREQLGVVNKNLAELNEKMNALAAKKCDTRTLGVFLESLGFDTESEEKARKEKAQLLVSAFESSAGSNLPSAKGTLWGAVNAVTYYVDHMGNLRERENGAQRQFENSIFGSGNKLKAEAFNLALSMAK